MRRQPMSPRKFKRVQNASQLDWQKGAEALGKELERHAFMALVEAKNGGAAIQTVRLTEPFSNDDMRGWDIVITDMKGVSHPLQVKSSKFAAQKFLQREQNAREQTPVIVPQLRDNYQQVLDKIGEVMPFLRGFKFEEGET